MAKTIQDIIDEIRIRSDVSHIDDDEILNYIDDLDDQLSESVFPKFNSVEVPIVSGVTSYDVSDNTEATRVVSVLLDGVKLTHKRDPYDQMDGWYADGSNIVITPACEEGTLTVIYSVKRVPHNEYAEISDINLAAPEAYHDLYIFYALSQIASKSADGTTYTNMKADYNSLLSEAITAKTKRQLFPTISL